MKILIVSGSFYPVNSPRSFRTTELVKELSKDGHDITLYIPQYNYDYTDFFKSYPLNIKYFNRTIEKRRYIGINIIDRIIFHIRNRFFNYPECKILPKVKKAIKKESNYDVLISIAVPHAIHWAIGYLYKRGHKIAKKWIADCGDPFMLTDSGKYRPPFYFKWGEKNWCRLCDYISVPTETSYKGYYPEFKNKIKVIPQAFNFEEVKLNKYIQNKVPTFAYSGVFIPEKRDPRPILDFLEQSNIDFKFIVYTKQHNMLQEHKKRLGDKIEIREYIPRLELLKELSTVDFLLNIENGTNVQTPSKLIDYALTKRPILSIDCNNIDTEKFYQFLNGNYSQQYIVNDIEKYNIKNVVKQFLNLA